MTTKRSQRGGNVNDLGNRWTRAREEELIGEYQQLPMLYDPSEPQFKNPAAKEYAMGYIAKKK